MFTIKNTGAMIVLCNFLDGAVADYEEGWLENLSLIEDCINTLKLLGDFTGYQEYKERITKAKEKRKLNS